MQAWKTWAHRISATEAERAVICKNCKRPRGEHPAPDEPGFGPASEPHQFEPTELPHVLAVLDGKVVDPSKRPT